MEIIESNMRFSYPDDQSYLVEKRGLVLDVEGIKSCEVFTCIKGKLVMIEAKSSSPRPNNNVRFDEFIAEVGQKFIDTLLFYNAAMLERYSKGYKHDFPVNLQNQSLKDIQYSFCLIIYGHQDRYMPPIQDALRNHLRNVLKLWNIPDINVLALNHENAKNKGLISQYLPKPQLDEFKNQGLKDESLIVKVKQWFVDNPVAIS